MTHIKHEVTVSVALLLWRKNKIGVYDELVLGRRTDSDQLTFIGGGVELGETVPEAAKREFGEETGKSLDEMAEWFYPRRGFPRFGYRNNKILNSIGIVYEALLDPSKEKELLSGAKGDGELKGLEVWGIGELTRRAIAEPTILFKPRWNLENLYDGWESLANRELLVRGNDLSGTDLMVRLQKAIRSLM